MKEYKDRLSYLVNDHGKNVLNPVERTFPMLYRKLFSLENSRGIWEKIEDCENCYDLVKGKKVLASIVGNEKSKEKHISLYTFKKPSDKYKEGRWTASNHDLNEEDLSELNQLLGSLRFSKAPFN